MKLEYTEEEIIDYWYSPEISKQWFAATTALDAEIRTKYESLWKAAAIGELDHWLASPQGCLALVIILDQFPLNVYRNRPQSFSTEARSIEVARHALEKRFDRALQPQQKAFLRNQLQRHHQSIELPQPDLFEEFDDELPTF